MKQVDLVPFAEYSEKIPETFFEPEDVKSPSSWQILGAHFVDFALSFMTSVFMCFMFNHFVKMLLVTKGLKLAYSEALIVGMAGPILPLTMFSYFFFSYFFNAGQTYGMYTFKIRASMNEQSFRGAFTWAVYSQFLCVSCGLSYFLKPSIWTNIKAHDHLYTELMSYKEDYSMNLLSRLDTKVEIQDQEWSKAA
jgi:hypothetical protein